MTAEVVAAIGENRAWRIGAVVDELGNPCKADIDGVLHRGIVDDRLSSDGHRQLFSRQPLQKQPIEDNFSGVVREIQNIIGFFDRPSKLSDMAVEWRVEAVVETRKHFVFVNVVFHAKVYDVSRDGQSHGEFQGIGRILNPAGKDRIEFKGYVVQSPFLLHVWIRVARHISNASMDGLGHCRRRLAEIHAGDTLQHVPNDCLVDTLVFSSRTDRLKGLAKQTRDAVEKCLH